MSADEPRAVDEGKGEGAGQKYTGTHLQSIVDRRCWDLEIYPSQSGGRVLGYGITGFRDFTLWQQGSRRLVCGNKDSQVTVGTLSRADIAAIVRIP
jgi:hypothetical protein